MYTVHNGNPLFHGCVPLNADGTFKKVSVFGKEYAGKQLYDVHADPSAAKPLDCGQYSDRRRRDGDDGRRKVAASGRVGRCGTWTGYVLRAF